MVFGEDAAPLGPARRRRRSWGADAASDGAAREMRSLDEAGVAALRDIDQLLLSSGASPHSPAGFEMDENADILNLITVNHASPASHKDRTSRSASVASGAKVVKTPDSVSRALYYERRAGRLANFDETDEEELLGVQDLNSGRHGSARYARHGRPAPTVRRSASEGRNGMRSPSSAADDARVHDREYAQSGTRPLLHLFKGGRTTHDGKREYKDDEEEEEKASSELSFASGRMPQHGGSSALTGQAGPEVRPAGETSDSGSHMGLAARVARLRRDVISTVKNCTWKDVARWSLIAALWAVALFDTGLLFSGGPRSDQPVQPGTDPSQATGPDEAVIVAATPVAHSGQHAEPAARKETTRPQTSDAVPGNPNRPITIDSSPPKVAIIAPPGTIQGRVFGSSLFIDIIVDHVHPETIRQHRNPRVCLRLGAQETNTVLGCLPAAGRDVLQVHLRDLEPGTVTLYASLMSDVKKLAKASHVFHVLGGEGNGFPGHPVHAPGSVASGGRLGPAAPGGARGAEPSCMTTCTQTCVSTFELDGSGVSGLHRAP